MRKVTPLNEGSLFTVKQMHGTEGTAFPGHTASIESVLVVVEGRCTIAFAESSHELGAGDTFVVPADKWHQITGDPDFKAVHVMPNEIRFDFSE